ncbi:threonine/serine ThrE exporter family protein [Knoellia subterranea]|uniref:threonine/serine ThrE exporter family protein n=1 Tax=Knoellia subterranea TaxID=184882 RepID=UPI000B02D911|nr:threonine/serine exporter family protein [Knoellia subterranea]
MSEHDRRRRAWRLQGGPPTEPMPLVDLLRRTPYRNARVAIEAAEEARVREALDLAVRLGELMLRSGAGAPQVEGSVAAVCAAAGLNHVEIDITLQSLLVHAHIDPAHAVTELRVVRSTRHDYARLVAVHELVDAFVSGHIELPEAIEQLRDIKRTRRIWPDWAVTVATAALAAAVAVMIGASLFTAGVTVLVVLGVSAVSALLGPFHLPDFYSNAVSAFVATALAWVAYALGAQGWIPLGGKDFAFIVAGGIVALLPGRTMASAVEDVISGYAVTGAGRLLAVTVSLTGLIIGVAVALSATIRLTEAMSFTFVSPSVLELRTSQAEWWASLAGAFIVGACGSVTMQTRRRLVLPTAALALAAGGAYALLTRVGDVGAVTATGIAAVALGFVGRLVALRLGAPAMAVVVPASFGLLPGLTIFRGLYELVGQNSTDIGTLSFQAGVATLLGAAGVLLAIATGTTLGEIFASRWDRRMARVRRRDRV